MKKKIILIVLGAVVVLLTSLWVANRHFGFVGQMQKVDVGRGIFPWKDVEACIDESTVELPSRCIWCGRHKKEIYFRSPAYTWENLCGVASDLTICEHCRWQYDSEMTSRN